MKLIVVGAGNIAIEYIKILHSLGIEPVVVGRGINNIIKIKEKFQGIIAFSGGIEKYFETNEPTEYSIVTTDLDNLSKTVKVLIGNNVKNILVEKPLTVSINSAKELVELSKNQNVKISIAFNRRAYQSVQKAKELIEMDGGVKSLHFDFSEAIYRQSKSDLEKYSKNNLKYWGICNSSHVIDTVFYLSGSPKWLKCEQHGDDIKWHPKGSIFTGIGQSSSGAPITYHSNWSCPGRWNIEIMTKNRKLFFSPMEKLKQQNLKSFLIEEVQIDYDLDNLYKPGFYIQVKEFLNNRGLFNINELPERLNLLNKIFNY